MFTQIQTEMEILIAEVNKVMDYVASMRAVENNPNVYAELGGRLIGHTEILSKIRHTQFQIDEHIKDIIRNTADGNFVDKLDILEEENILLNRKIDLLKDELQKYKQGRINANNLPAECLKELSEQEIDNKIDEVYERDDYDYEYLDDNDLDDDETDEGG